MSQRVKRGGRKFKLFKTDLDCSNLFSEVRVSISNTTLARLKPGRRLSRLNLSKHNLPG